MLNQAQITSIILFSAAANAAWSGETRILLESMPLIHNQDYLAEGLTIRIRVMVPQHDYSLLHRSPTFLAVSNTKHNASLLGEEDTMHI